MSDIVQMGTVLAVAAGLFFGLGIWFANGREREPAGGKVEAEPDARADREVEPSAELETARRELEAAREEIASLHEDLSRARAKIIEPGERGDAPPTPTLGTEVDPDLGKIYAVRPESVDDLTKIRGVGKAISRQLNGLGVYTLAQIASWEKAQVEAFSVRMSFKDRILRDDWVGQAKRLC